MERVIKFEYIFDTGKKVVLSLDEIQSGKLLDYFLNGFGNVLYRRIFTGLTDKNGKDIYEGDIVCSAKSLNTTKGVVVFEKGGFFLRCNKDEVYALWWFNESKGEVLGNIYENPELLSTDKTKTV